MKYHTVLFDLDGTITDSGQGIMNAIRYAVDKAGFEEVSEDILRSFIGPPLKEQFIKVFNLSDEEGKRMVEFYREYYGVKGIYENCVYEGIPELLVELRSAGIRVIMATSKPEKYAKLIASHFKFEEYFDYIGGACMDGSRTDKTEVIEYVLDACGIKDGERKNVVMVGDRRHDIYGAGNCGLHSIGVLYGYGSREELIEAGAEYIADTPADIKKLVLQNQCAENNSQ